MPDETIDVFDIVADSTPVEDIFSPVTDVVAPSPLDPPTISYRVHSLGGRLIRFSSGRVWAVPILPDSGFL